MVVAGTIFKIAFELIFFFVYCEHLAKGALVFKVGDFHSEDFFKFALWFAERLQFADGGDAIGLVYVKGGGSRTSIVVVGRVDVPS